MVNLATVTDQIEVNDASMEVVKLTVTDGEGYFSKKFGTILGAIVSGNENNDAHINVTFSDSIAVINYDGITDQLVTLVLFGRK